MSRKRKHKRKARAKRIKCLRCGIVVDNVPRMDLTYVGSGKWVCNEPCADLFELDRAVHAEKGDPETELIDLMAKSMASDLDAEYVRDRSEHYLGIKELP